MTRSTYQHTRHETNFKYCWYYVECKSTQHKVDASTMHIAQLNINNDLYNITK